MAHIYIFFLVVAQCFVLHSAYIIGIKNHFLKFTLFQCWKNCNKSSNAELPLRLGTMLCAVPVYKLCENNGQKRRKYFAR